MASVEEITNEARAAASKIAATVNLRQRIFMPQDQLIVLLMDAYARGLKGGVDRSVEQFAPAQMSKYRALTG